MPQEIHVVQCYSCQMYQVDIVKKVPKWTCKLCGKKQSLKQVFYVGSGKDCRLQVQKLNDLKRSSEQMNVSTENVSPNIRQSSDVPPLQTTTTSRPWSDFFESFDEDDLDVASAEDTMVQETCSKEENHQQYNEKTNVPSISTYDNIRSKRVHENNTICPNEFLEVPVAKLRKIETDAPTPEWNRFLSDESD